jgi:hypothetical protein
MLMPAEGLLVAEVLRGNRNVTSRQFNPEYKWVMVKE